MLEVHPKDAAAARLNAAQGSVHHGEVHVQQTDWVMKTPHQLDHKTGLRLRAGAAFIVVAVLSLGLGWSLWEALHSWASAMLKFAR
jgi:hypothetical protein